MTKLKTVIDLAKELIEEGGKEYAIAELEKQIMEIGEPGRDFQKVCNISGLKAAILWVKEQGLTFLFATWVNCEKDRASLLKSDDGKIYCRRYGIGIEEITLDWAMHLTWMHINRTGDGWPKKMGENGIPVVAISKEEQDTQCKMMLKLN